MSDSPRDRIARKLFDLYAAHLGYADAPWFIVDTPWDSAFHQPWLDEADAVISELQQQWRADFGYDGHSRCASRDEAKELVDDFNDALGDDVRDGEQAMVMRRWVTDWEADDE